MTMTLLEICQEAVETLIGLNVPTTIATNTGDPDAVGLLTAAKATGRELARKYSWQALITPSTFATVAGTSQYAIPADFQRFVNDTFYNVSQFWQLNGPLLPSAWAFLNRGLAPTTYLYDFTVRGNFINLQPVPSSVQTIGYDYYTKQYSTTPGGTAQDNWLTDDDLPRLYPDLFVLGVRYRFRRYKELPYADDKQDYYDAIADHIFDDTPKATTSLSGTSGGAVPSLPNYDIVGISVDSEFTTMDSE